MKLSDPYAGATSPVDALFVLSYTWATGQTPSSGSGESRGGAVGKEDG